MPFISQTPLSFTRSGIEQLAPNQIGVYGIYNAAGWIYVGKGDIRERLLAHLNGDNPCILLFNPTNFVAEVTENHDLREILLILELDPACNKKVG